MHLVQYRIPHGAVDALVAEGHLPPPPRHMRLWRVAGPRMEWLYRLLGPVFRLLEVRLRGAVDGAGGQGGGSAQPMWPAGGK